MTRIPQWIAGFRNPFPSLLLSGSQHRLNQFWNRLERRFLVPQILGGCVTKNLVLVPPCHWWPANGRLQMLLLVNSRTSRNGWVRTNSAHFINHTLTSNQISTQSLWKHLFLPPKTQPNGQFWSSGMAIGQRGIMSSIKHWAGVVLSMAQKV